MVRTRMRNASRGLLRRFSAVTFVFAAVFLLGVNVFGMQEADEEVGVTLAAPDAVSVADTPNDAGESLTVRWRKSADDDEATIPRKVLSYEIQRREGGQDDDAWAKAGEATYGVSQFVDQGCERGKTYEYRVIAFGAAGLQSEASGGSAGIAPVVQWFDTSKAWFLILLLVVGGSVIYFIEAAKAGKELKVRKIAGLVAVEEAVGRATELGRSVLFVPGIQDINDNTRSFCVVRHCAVMCSIQCIICQLPIQ